MVTMRNFCCQQTAVLLGTLVLTASATTRYVDVNGVNATPPYTSWATAATTIQDAVDAAGVGDLVLVTNGVYQTGATAVYGMSNRVAVTKPLTVQSVNGPTVTSIVGYQVPGTTNGAAAVRCVYLTNGALMAGFTLTNGATQSSGDIGKNQCGGGVWCESMDAAITNCVLSGNSSASEGGGVMGGALNNCTLTGNSAYFGGGGVARSRVNNCLVKSNWARFHGGGAVWGTLNNCLLTGNAASFGGGVSSCTLNNCTLTGNSASSHAGGAYLGTLNNCVVYYNRAVTFGDNYYYSKLDYCCTVPLPGHGTGNLVAEPQLVDNWHLSASSPCLGAGNPASASGADLEGEPWSAPPSIGCDEYWSGSLTGAVSVAITASHTNVAVGFGVDFNGLIGGQVSASRLDFGDGTVVSNRPHASHAWAATGSYAVELRAYNESYPEGVAATVTVQVVTRPVHYVSLSSPAPTPPYTSWGAAATTIQDAVNAAEVPGALVMVNDGVYQTGGAAVSGTSNRVAVTKPITVQSVNGPTVTSIVGYQVPGTTNGAAAIRCVYLCNGSALTGFTITNGATWTFGDSFKNRSGGGVWCEGSRAMVSSGVLENNSSSYYGGGAYQGTLSNCKLTGNTASYGGGAYQGVLNNCTLTRNAVSSYGGGAYYGTLYNCTLSGNSASDGGGSHSTTLNNCIVYYNTATGAGKNYSGDTCNHCCTTPLPSSGAGNITGAPQFVDTNGWSNLRLSTNSPCINAGDNAYSSGATDQDGNPRVVGGTVDMGAYEHAAEGLSPWIVGQPQDAMIWVGGPATFSVTAAGRTPLSYFWQRDGLFIAGATNSTYSIANVALSDFGSQFCCLVSNLFGTVTSEVALLTVIPDLGFEVWGGNVLPDPYTQFYNPGAIGYTKLHSTDGRTFHGQYSYYVISALVAPFSIDAIQRSDGNYFGFFGSSSTYSGNISGSGSAVRGPPDGALVTLLSPGSFIAIHQEGNCVLVQRKTPEVWIG
jgi:hypothetical protein